MQLYVEALLRWVLFTVAVGTAPVIANAIIAAMQSGSSWMSVVVRGDPLIVAVVICAAGVGQLLARGARFPWLRIVSGGGCLLVIVTGSLLFGHLQLTPEPVMGGFGVISGMYGFGVVSSTAAALLAEVR